MFEKSILYDFTPEELQTLLNSSNSYADVLRKVGLNTKGANPETLKKIIKEYQLDETLLNENRIKLFSKNAKETHKKVQVPIEKIFNNEVSVCHSNIFLKRLVAEKYKEYKCECCGISEWMGKPITLQLHHKDGDHNNNMLSNLEILCPNCHTQTDNYGGKVSKEINKEKKKKENIRYLKEKMMI